ncbi:multidrug efflux RND transporter MexF [Cyanobium sp. PCC 7001]|uniref:efflux RND transporter permease subunit n=1 Tax=Cyanobium sp. PCC 7001 TaxID=180281 RepID=UPI0001805A87|nr:efflux RND transporter permease subunit [Cyanobium sp. PCC 7001]EDY39551.1 multidrug efflux RND transporter MexF [Cyanobium sp. PCC 7001]
MKSISDPFLRRPVLTLVISLLVLLAGFVSLPGLQIENLPPIAPGRVTVSTSYPGASPEVVEQGVTTLLEKQLNGLERLDQVRSTSSAGSSSITLSFEGGDPEINQINAQNEAAVVNPRLPPQVARFGVRVRRSSDDLLMVLSFSADRDLYDDTFLSGWVEQVVIDRLQRVSGVGEARLFGGSPLAFRLWLDPARLNQLGLTITDVRDALEEQNVLAALGQAGDAPAPDDQMLTLPLRMEGRLRSVQEFEQLVVAPTPEGGVTLLRDVGRVTLGSENYDAIATNLQGKATVAMGIFQRDGSNALDVSRGISTALDEITPNLPPGVEFQVIIDEAETVRQNIDRTLASLRDAVLLVFLALLLGLGNSRLALLSALVVPVALVGSLTVLRLTDSSINTLTLFGMVLATGLVVDDAIVVSEDIGRRIEQGHPPLLAAREAMAELGGAVVATSLVLIAVFLPVLTLGGSTGRLYAPIGLTIGATIVFSTFNALTFTPVAASRLLPAGGGGEPAWLLRWIDPPRRALESLEGPYDRWLTRALGWRRRIVALLLVGLLLTAAAYQQRPKAFIPQEDGSQLRGVVVLPDGMALARTQAVMERVRQVIAEEPLVVTGNFYAGRSFGDSGPNKGIFFLRLKPVDERQGSDQTPAALAARLNGRLAASIGDAQVVVIEAPTVRGFGSEGGIEFELLDTSGGRLSLTEFEQVAQSFIEAAQATGAFERVNTRFVANAPLVRLEPDRLKLGSLGVDLEELVEVLGASFGSDYVNDSFEGDRVRRVIVQLEGAERRNVQDVLALQVRGRDDTLIPLAEVVRVVQDTGPTVINHTRLVRSIGIRAQPLMGVSTGQAMDRLQEVRRELGSSATDLEWAGLAREEARAGGANEQVFLLAVVVMVLVLAGLYENFIDPMIILVTVPLGLLGGIAGLAIRDLPLDVYGRMGLLVLVSLAAKNGILIVEFANQRLAAGMPLEQAIHGAAVARLRPILLTAISSLAGFMPLLFASGAGAASRTSIGTVVFAGLLVATVLSLFVVPVIYRIVKGWELGRQRSRGAQERGSEAF